MEWLEPQEIEYPDKGVRVLLWDRWHGRGATLYPIEVDTGSSRTNYLNFLPYGVNSFPEIGVNWVKRGFDAAKRDVERRLLTEDNLAVIAQWREMFERHNAYEEARGMIVDCLVAHGAQDRGDRGCRVSGTHQNGDVKHEFYMTLKASDKGVYIKDGFIPTEMLEGLFTFLDAQGV